MSVSYKSPGVYVEEIDRGIKPIQGVGMSTAAFMGITAEASIKSFDPATGERIVVESVLGKATLVTSWTQFTKIFGEFVAGAYLPDTVYGYFANGGGPCYVTSVRALKEGDSSATAAQVAVPAKSKTAFTAVSTAVGESGNQLTLDVAHDKDADGKAAGTVTLSVGSDVVRGLSMKKSDGNYIGNASFKSVQLTDIAGTTLPDEGSYSLNGGGMSPLEPKDFIGDVGKRLGLGGLEANEDIRLVVCPDLMAGYDGSAAARQRIKAVQDAIITHCEQMRYRFAILDTPPGLTPAEAKIWRDELGSQSSYASLYYPWIEVPDLGNGGTKLVPPSGHVAGVYNRVDSERGVHKAPANEIIRGVVATEINISRKEQDNLNPIGVNCIRSFANRGIRIWGARTLSTSGSWTYIPVRRLFIYVEASMDISLQWVVFEPNDVTLWGKITRDVTSFLRSVWGSGALFGATESEAFYVKCDSELNNSEIRDMGQVIIEVGLSPVKPAEFVIFRISQWSGGGVASDDGGGEGEA